VALDESADQAAKEKARKDFQDSLTAIDPIFSEKPFFMSDEYTLVDCCMAAILWRLPLMGITIDKEKAPHLQAYMGRLFERESFKASLSDLESDMQHDHISAV